MNQVSQCVLLFDLNFHFATAFVTTPLSIGSAVALTGVITFIVAVVIGFITGLLVMYLCMRRKAVYSPRNEGQANVGPTAPAGPVYEDVSHKEEIELNTNKAYGQVRL